MVLKKIDIYCKKIEKIYIIKLYIIKTISYPLLEIMTLSKEEACKIVNDYIKLLDDFFNNLSRDFQNYTLYSINEIMFIIGKYNLIIELEYFINNIALEKYYEYINLFYFTMLAAVHYKNTEIIDVLVKFKNIDVNNYEIIYKNQMKRFDRELINMMKL
jgi:hypothetical protein